MYELKINASLENNTVVVSCGNDKLKFKRNDHRIVFIYKINTHDDDLIAISIPAKMESEFLKDLYKVYPSTPIFTSLGFNDIGFACGYFIGVLHADSHKIA